MKQAYDTTDLEKKGKAFAAVSAGASSAIKEGNVSGNSLTDKLSAQEASEYLEKHHYSSKHLFHPIRPLFTVSTMLFLLLIGTIIFFTTYNTVVLSGFIFAAVFLCADDIVMAPALQSFKYWTHTREGHKKTKSIGGLIILVLGIVGGTLIGFFLLSGHHWVQHAMQMVIKDLETNMTVMVGFAVASGLLAKKLNASMPLCFLIVFLGTSLPVWLGQGGIHMHIPMVVDITIMSAVLVTFFSMVLYKHVMRGYHKVRYGHTNADGYFYAVKDKTYDIDQTRAENLGKSAEIVNKLRIALRHVVKAIKVKCNFMEDVCGGQMAMTEPYKDIHYLLMSEHGDKEALDERLQEYRDLYALKDVAEKTVAWTEIPVWKILKLKFTYRYEQLKRKWSKANQPSDDEKQAKELRDSLNDKVNFWQSMNATPNGKYDYKTALHKRGLESSLAFAREPSNKGELNSEANDTPLQNAQKKLFNGINDYFIVK